MSHLIARDGCQHCSARTAYDIGSASLIPCITPGMISRGRVAPVRKIIGN